MAPQPPLSVAIITPAPRGSLTGNRVTAVRWAKRLRELGHKVALRERFEPPAPDCIVALHAVKSAASIERCHERSPKTAIVVALTGTDVYGDSIPSDAALRSFELAKGIVALQPLALEKLPPALRSKGRVIYQSATPL